MRFFSLQSPGGEFHGGTKRRSNSLQFRVTKTCSPPEGNFTEERGTSAHCQLCTAHPVAVPRRGISRRNPSYVREWLASAAAEMELQSPGGEFHGGTGLIGPTARAARPNVAVPRRGISRRNLRTRPGRYGHYCRSCSPPEGNFTEERHPGRRPRASAAVIVLQSPGGEFHGGTWTARGAGAVASNLCCSPPEGNFTEEQARTARGGLVAPVHVAVPRRGISRRNPSRIRQSSSGRYFLVAVPRRGISRRNLEVVELPALLASPVAVPRRGISRRNLTSVVTQIDGQANRCSPPEGNFTEELRIYAPWRSRDECGHVAVPRRGISRRNTSSARIPRGFANRRCSPPEGNFTEERRRGPRRVGAPARRVAVPRRGISRRNSLDLIPDWDKAADVAVPRRGISRRN